MLCSATNIGLVPFMLKDSQGVLCCVVQHQSKITYPPGDFMLCNMQSQLRHNIHPQQKIRGLSCCAVPSRCNSTQQTPPIIFTLYGPYGVYIVFNIMGYFLLRYEKQLHKTPRVVLGSSVITNPKQPQMALSHNVCKYVIK